MGDLSVGDDVVTPFGTTTRITGVYPKGVRPVYRLTLRDGSSTEACNQHLWEIERSKSAIRYTGGTDENGKRKYVGTGPDGKTFEMVKEVIDMDDLRERVEKGRAINLPRVSPIPYVEQDLPVDPYVLGAILGDGHIQPNGVVKFTCADPEIVDEIRRRGYTVVDDTVRGERKDGIGYRINGVNASMRDLGVARSRSWEKTIPEMYLYGSIEQRLDLLRGLMDTDGTISARGEMEFTSSSVDLAEGVQTIVRSLGGRVNINVKEKVFYTSPNQQERTQARAAYRVQNIRLQEVNPFFLPRKADRWVPRTDNSGNRVVSVEYVRDEEVQCIRVADERHLYVTDDFIPTHNTSNIIFLKSTDDTMLEQLEKMSGTTHRPRRTTKSVTHDVEALALGNEKSVNYTITDEKEPLISFNDLLRLPMCNAIVFRANQAPIWDRLETAMPMSWALFSTRMKDNVNGGEFDLKSIPSLSGAAESDPLKAMPNFMAMFEKRIDQASKAETAVDIYKKGYDLSEYEWAQIDMDVKSAEIMDIVDIILDRERYSAQVEVDREREMADEAAEAAMMQGSMGRDSFEQQIAMQGDVDFSGGDYDEEDEDPEVNPNGYMVATEDTEAEYAARAKATGNAAELDQDAVNTERQAKAYNAERDLKRFAGKMISISDLVRPGPHGEMVGKAVPSALDDTFSVVVEDLIHVFEHDSQFAPDGRGGLVLADTGEQMIVHIDETEDYTTMRQRVADEDDRVYAFDEQAGDGGTGDGIELPTKVLRYTVTDGFKVWLAGLPNWKSIADGRFDTEVNRAMVNAELSSTGQVI